MGQPAGTQPEQLHTEAVPQAPAPAKPDTKYRRKNLRRRSAKRTAPSAAPQAAEQPAATQEPSEDSPMGGACGKPAEKRARRSRARASGAASAGGGAEQCPPGSPAPDTAGRAAAGDEPDRALQAAAEQPVAPASSASKGKGNGAPTQAHSGGGAHTCQRGQPPHDPLLGSCAEHATKHNDTSSAHLGDEAPHLGEDCELSEEWLDSTPPPHPHRRA
jgi:hypothetical protein